MNTNKRKKLNLSRTTIRTLTTMSDEQLAAAAGGRVPTSDSDMLRTCECVPQEETGSSSMPASWTTSTAAL